MCVCVWCTSNPNIHTQLIHRFVNTRMYKCARVYIYLLSSSYFSSSLSSFFEDGLRICTGKEREREKDWVSDCEKNVFFICFICMWDVREIHSLSKRNFLIEMYTYLEWFVRFIYLKYAKKYEPLTNKSSSSSSSSVVVGGEEIHTFTFSYLRVCTSQHRNAWIANIYIIYEDRQKKNVDTFFMFLRRFRRKRRSRVNNKKVLA